MNERIQILNMLSEGKITVEETQQLLEALESSTSQAPPQKTCKWLRILVVEKGEEKVKVNIPLSLARMGLTFLPEAALLQINSKGIDLNKILREDFNTPGKIVDFKERDTSVEVYVE